MSAPGGTVPLIAHVVFRLDVGGLENGLVNLINGLGSERFRHAVICLTDYTDFHRRITAPNVDLIALHKPPGNSLRTHARMLSLLHRMRPAIVHTRNLAAQEHQLSARLLGVPVRIQSEHGRDGNDAEGTNRKHLAIRRGLRPLVHHYVTVSQDLERYLIDRIGVSRDRVTHICNGVDTDRFSPVAGQVRAIGPAGFADTDCVIVGTVGRMDPIKDPLNLVRAFIEATAVAPDLAPRLRLVMVGDGVLRKDALALLESNGLLSQAWLPGSMSNVPELMRGLDLFVLPSISEGISNTILEAMASALPVVATRVGGNPELIIDGRTGCLVPRGDSGAIARAIVDYARQPDVRLDHSRQARRHALEHFSLLSMIDAYARLYDAQLVAHGWAPTVSNWRASSATPSR